MYQIARVPFFNAIRIFLSSSSISNDVLRVISTVVVRVAVAEVVVVDGDAAVAKSELPVPAPEFAEESIVAC